ncbi:hypothetical protein H0H93_009651 [Arthromyces matolae]|nr:hypothetical protein H0H93_009651 [Arthromyces matolae]
MSSTPIVKINAAEYPIKSVAIFKSSKAEIVRHFSFNLKAGQTKVEIRGLSGSIDTHSIRVSGLGEARLYDVVCTIGVSKDTSYASDSPSEIIRLLNVKKQSLENEKRVREHEADLLVNYAKTLNGEHVQPTQMSTFLESFVEQGRKNLIEIVDLEEKIISIQRQIERETEKRVSKKGDATGKVSIVLGTDNDTAVDLKLTYIVGNVLWQPTYELHAKTESGKPSPAVSLHYRARVTQSTGEDWTNTSLTLSTMSSDTIAKRIPRLIPVKLQPRKSFVPGGLFNNSNVAQAARGGSSLFGQGGNQRGFPPQAQAQANQVQQAQQAPVLTTFAAFAPNQYASSFGQTALVNEEEENFEEVSAPEAISEPTTFVNETPVAISFSISGESTIPSDGIDHQVSVAILPFEAKISYVAIPRIEPRVYLHCDVKNGSEYRLLAGPVTVILDDSYVSKTSINDVSTGENFECTLGDDAATKVTYSRTARTVKSEAGSFVEAQNTTTYTTLITIHNKHVFPLTDMVVRDAVPTVDDKRAKVILRKPEGLASLKDGEEAVVRKDNLEIGKVSWEKLVDGKGGEKEGKFTWKASVKAKDKIVLESQWELKAPADGTFWQESLVN